MWLCAKEEKKIKRTRRRWWLWWHGNEISSKEIAIGKKRIYRIRIGQLIESHRRAPIQNQNKKRRKEINFFYDHAANCFFPFGNYLPNTVKRENSCHGILSNHKWHSQSNLKCTHSFTHSRLKRWRTKI